MARSKIVGLDVSPVTENSSRYLWRVPVLSSCRLILSSQRLWPRSWSCLVGFISASFFNNSCQIVVHQITDAADCDVCGRVGGNNLRIECVMSLTHKDRCQLIAPDFLHCRQNPDFVIEHDVMRRRI